MKVDPTKPAIGRMLLRTGLVLAVLLASARFAPVMAQAPSISDPEVMDRLRNRLYRMLNNGQPNAKVQAPERNVLRLTRQQAPTKPKAPEKPASPPAPADPLQALVLAALAREPSLPHIPLCPEKPAEDPTVLEVPAVLAPAVPPQPRRLKLVTPEREVSPCPPLDAGPVALPPPPVEWAYVGLGAPENWGRLRADYAACLIGEQQSPVALGESIPVQPTPLDLRYRASRFYVIDDGRSLLVTLDGASTLVVDGQRLRLRQIRFHRPGEHMVDGVRPDMSAHLIHESGTGTTVAVAVPLMIDRADDGQPGERPGNPVLQQVLNNMPLDPGGSQRGVGRLDPAALLPAEHDRFAYVGSLTTPPCTEGVHWLVLRRPMSISRLQFEVFEKMLPASARPLQALNGRRVKGTM
ncbi:MAG: carbonic anhydrase family protein [Burkholderiaceae bacterium]